MGLAGDVIEKPFHLRRVILGQRLILGRRDDRIVWGIIGLGEVDG
jgi:hypothetical protein